MLKRIPIVWRGVFCYFLIRKMRDEAIVKPRRIRKYRRKRSIYIPFDFPDGVLLDSIQENVLEKKNLGCGTLFLLPNKIILYQSIGAPAAVLALESLIASWTREVIILGICGSLNPRYRLCEAAVIRKALSEEGTSRHYFPRRRIFFSSSSLKSSIEKTLHKKALPFHKGSIASTDAPFRETPDWLSRVKKRGIDFVDMEASAVFALAEYRRVEAAALMIVSDELFGRRWKTGFRALSLKKRMKEYFLPFILG